MVERTNMEQNLDKIFDIEGADALVEIINENAGEVLLPENKNEKTVDREVQEDYAYARNNLKSVIDSGEDALDSLIQIAKVSQHPRAFEVIGQLMKIIVESNKDLLDLKRQANDLNGESKEDKKESKGNVTNALFVGSTKELQQMIKDGTVPTGNS